MKTLFIAAKYKGEVKIDPKAFEKLPDRVGLVSSVQFLDRLKDIKKDFEKYGKKAIIGGQILGCDASAAKNIEKKVDAFLYIGDGAFHPIGIALKTKKAVFTYDPADNVFDKISDDEILKYKNRQKGAFLKYLSSTNIGIIVSTKPGQEKLKAALKLKDHLERKGKNAYIFTADNIDLNELEDFPFIECWVNTACPRLRDDFENTAKTIINLEEI
ncbi:MAG: diphthamide synthesis protein [Candidatus Woesearchaeota archaeon]|nr:diphthamide synthesis protein [Candidatus Woesearchaeota archaeon]